MASDIERGLLGPSIVVDTQHAEVSTVQVAPERVTGVTEAELARHGMALPDLNANEALSSVPGVPERPQNALQKIAEALGAHPDTYDAAQVIRSMHFRNVQYMRSKVIKHRLVLRTNGSKNSTIREAFAESYTPARLDLIRDDLAHYTTAVRDYEYWKQTFKVSTGQSLSGFTGTADLAALECNAEIISGDRAQAERNIVGAYNDIRRRHLKPIKGSVIGSHLLTAFGRVSGTSQFIAAIDDEKYETKRSKFIERVSFAFFGRVALIAPMLIMTLHSTRLTALLTTSVFVTFVAGVLAWSMEDAQNKDIVAATAAYAAVLVVFVGTAMTPGSTSGF